MPARCERTGKHGYGTKLDAMIATMRLPARDRFYRCEFCALWHRTTQAKRQRPA